LIHAREDIFAWSLNSKPWRSFAFNLLVTPSTPTPRRRNYGTRRCKLLQLRTYPATETGVDFGTIVRTFGYPPTVYWSMFPLRNDLSQIRNAACSLGLFGVRMDGWFGVRRWFAAVVFW